MSQPPGSEAKAKRQILVGLSSALSALSDRMRTQQDAAVKLTVLAVRAEKIAEQAWALNNTRSQDFQRDSEALGRDVNAFAVDVSDAAKRAGKEALLGREVAQAITAHSGDIVKLGLEIDSLPNAAAVRVRLRPLSQTLAVLPERLKANASTIKDVNKIAERAGELAQRGDRIAAGGANADREAVTLCSDLRRFAEDATAISLEMTRGSAMAVKALDEMAEKTVGLSRGEPEPKARSTAAELKPVPTKEARKADEVWVSTAPKRDAQQIKGGAVWGAAGKG
jgi:hypothetical protein